MKKVVVTGIGAITPLGPDFSSLMNAVYQGQSGVKALDTPWISQLHSPLAAPVLFPVEDHFTKLRRLMLDRVAQLGLLAVKEAVNQAQLDTSVDAGLGGGIFWGTGMGGAHTLEQAYMDSFSNPTSRPRPTTIVMFMTNSTTGQIGIEHKIKGPSTTYSSACSSSAVAIGEAFEAIRHGKINYAVAGGSEALLTLGVMKAWESLQTLARPDKEHPETSCRPFSKDRSGFILGEGAASLILESEEHAIQRGANILCEIVGYGNTTDASHITQPDANGQARAMSLALFQAGLSINDVDYINAHGTGTQVGDISETKAIHHVFGDRAKHIPVSATKALHGHLMGATGAVEMAIALGSLLNRQIPGTAHLFNPDSECDLDYVSEGARVLEKIDVVMSNSFGFGGNNAVLVAKRYR
ncbi:beta-ketoacyl-[acyl-carrier-protein] synthase family protein [Ferrovum sp. PN-J185]|uniref:beta-ketoacyl-[acyl-carrier-protein] synthase family protein n=1 Tax=Ferrovum sp. PN-J185 TaxID=1356306 RepID=UPI001E29F93A|nr:beta-ketoacyl-[acyl-carrier-protein] synthase family protein [Ferrovum sp. PN-J185]MCC6068874.1 beta-ketoacyl-[acyl-carrier-protein] synthase family protein [Ferrovum sp. PN-J185]MDE1891166.1 beta-ketoacyl-[acyl-carrier-protein] synthase family protein [Betaproteobacteria bacterium]